MSAQVTKTYDPKCHDLAANFLDDRFAKEEEVASLARAIQTAIEDWLEENPAESAERAEQRERTR